MALVVNNPIQEIQSSLQCRRSLGPSLGQEDLLEKEMAAHASILVWTVPWAEEPGGL